MILSVQIFNHPGQRLFHLDTHACQPPSEQPASVARTKTTSCLAGSLTAYSPMLAPCVRAWLLFRHVEVEEAAKKPCLQEISKTSVAEFLVVKHDPAVGHEDGFEVRELH
jgi:hypothetical protein